MIKIKMYNEQFYTAHPSIYTFIDVIKQIQYTTIIKIVVLVKSKRQHSHFNSNFQGISTKFSMNHIIRSSLATF
jgi:hypothetical protein